MKLVVLCSESRDREAVHRDKRPRLFAGCQHHFWCEDEANLHELEFCITLIPVFVYCVSYEMDASIVVML